MRVSGRKTQNDTRTSFCVRLFRFQGACDTVVPGERGFGLTLFEQSSYGSRELGKDWTGNSVYLWAVANAAYMSLMGPAGFHDVGTTILRGSHYAAKQIGELPGVEIEEYYGGQGRYHYIVTME